MGVHITEILDKNILSFSQKTRVKYKQTNVCMEVCHCQCIYNFQASNLSCQMCDPERIAIL